MKKIFTLIAALTLSAGLWAQNVYDQFEDATSGLKFYVTAVGEANTVKVIKNNYTGTSYTIPATVKYKDVDFAVTKIEGTTFQECSSLLSVTIPASVTTIGAHAFDGCSSLQSVTLSEGLLTIGAHAFDGCSSLQSITIPASVTTIGDNAFSLCSGLTSVTFLGNACQNAIGENAFYSVGSTTPATLVLPADWTGTKPDQDGGWYFGYFKLTAPAPDVPATLDSLVIKGKAEKMEYELGEAFDPAGLEVWGIYTKYVKNDSTSLIKSGITWTLDPETFEEASDNASVTMVASYKEFTTADTTITSIKVKEKVPKYTTYENWQIKYGNTWVWSDNMEKVEEGLFKLEISWEGTGFNVKSDDNPIKKDWYDPDDPDVHIAEEVIPTVTVDVYLRVIDDEHLKIGIGEAPPIQFVDTASGLKFEIISMEEPRTVKVINNDYPGTSYTVPGTVTYWEKTFDVTEIGVEAFHDCSSLESITLPESVTTLAYASLANSGLTSITIPATVTKIGEYAFSECPLQSVTFQGDDCQFDIGEDAFYNVGSTEIPATLVLPDTWTGSTPDQDGNWYGGHFDYDAPASGPTVDETGITVNGRKYGFPVRLVKEVK